jgi:transglutaminase-like putative cysteine protease
MIYEIYHETKFDYAGLVTFSHNIARLKPKDSNTQKLLEYSLKIEPTPYETSEFIDYFENTNNYMLIRESHKNLKVIATSRVERIKEEIDKELNLIKEIKTTVKELKERLST